MDKFYRLTSGRLLGTFWQESCVWVEENWRPLLLPWLYWLVCSCLSVYYIHVIYIGYMTVAHVTCWSTAYYPPVFGTWALLLLIYHMVHHSQTKKILHKHISRILSLCNVTPSVRIPQKQIHVMFSEQLQSHFSLNAFIDFYFWTRMYLLMCALNFQTHELQRRCSLSLYSLH